MKNPAISYRQISVQGATPLGLVVMLYDGAIAALRRAIVATEAKDISEKCTHLAHAQAIFLQLEGSLNHAQGGEVANTLKSLYVYARGQILKANLENSPGILRHLVEKIVPLREAWYSADQRSPEVAAGGSIPIPANGNDALGGIPSSGPGQGAENPHYAAVPVDEPSSWKLSG